MFLAFHVLTGQDFRTISDILTLLSWWYGRLNYVTKNSAKTVQELDIWIVPAPFFHHKFRMGWPGIKFRPRC